MRARFFGQYLVANGWLTAPQLMAAVEYQERNNTKLGECAVALGLATPFEIEQILALQAREDLLFGEAAVKLGVLDEQQLARVRAAQNDRHRQLGEVLVTLGYLDPDQVESAAAEFLTGEARIQAEVVTVPEHLPLHDVAFELFHLAHKLLLRVCGLSSKTERLRVVESPMPLSDYNARVVIAGAVQSHVLVCVPETIATDVAGPFSGELPPSAEARERIVAELANLLCENLRSVLAEQGLRIRIGDACMVGSQSSLPPGTRLALVPFLTHRGQVLFALSLPS